jgi:hypothetical protein
MTGDPVLFAIAEQELGEEGVIALDQVPPNLRPKEGMGVTPIASKMTEDLCLLEAVCVSPKLANVLVKASGISVLTRCIGMISMIKAKTEAQNPKTLQVLNQAGKGTARRLQLLAQAGGTALQDKMLPEHLQEEGLMRASNTLTGLGRLNIDSKHSVPGLDPVPTSATSSKTGAGISGGGFRGFYRALSSSSSPAGASSAAAGGMGGVGGGSADAGKERLLAQAGLSLSNSSGSAGGGHRRRRTGKILVDEMQRVRSDIGRGLFRLVVVKTLVRSINTCSRLAAHASAASIALGVMAQGMAGAPSSPLEMVIQLAGVEAITSVMRSHSDHIPALIASSNALGLITVSGRAIDDATGLLRSPAPAETPGSASVATRGGTRQIIRELQVGATGQRWNSAFGQAALCGLLRVLLGVADTAKGADLLRKQGTVEALINTLDSSAIDAAAGLNLGGEGGDSAAAAKAKGVSSGSGGTSSGAAGDEGMGGIPLDRGISNDAFFGSGLDAALSGSGVIDDLNSAASAQSAEATTLIIAILSKLMDTKDLADAIRIIRQTAEKAANFTLKGAGVTLCTAALTTVLALAGNDNGRKVSADLWTQALEACSLLANNLVKCTSDSADAIGKAGSRMSSADIEVHKARAAFSAVATQVLFPSTSRAVGLILHSGEEYGAKQFGPRWTAAGLSCTSAAVRMARHATAPSDSGENIPASASAVRDRVRRAFLAGVRDGLDTTLIACSMDPAIASEVLTSEERLAESLSSSLSRFVDTSEIDAAGLSLEIFLELAYLAPTPENPSLPDGVKALLGVAPSVADCALRAVPMFLANGSPGGYIGGAFIVAGKLANADDGLAQSIRSKGDVPALTKQAMQRFCGQLDSADPMLCANASRVVEGVATVLAPLSGRVNEQDETAESAGKTNAALAGKVMSLVGEDATGSYINDDNTMIAVCDLVTATCKATVGETLPTPPAGSPIVDELSAAAARTAVLDVDGRSIIVTAMSKASASPLLLRAGARALEALGGGAGGAAADVRRAVEALRSRCKMAAIEKLLPLGDGAIAGADVASAGTVGSIESLLENLDTASRNLSAVLAGETSSTMANYRYIFDTLLYASETSVAVRAKMVRGEVDGVATATGGNAAAGVASPAAGAHDRTASAPALSHRSNFGSRTVLGVNSKAQHSASALPIMGAGSGGLMSPASGGSATAKPSRLRGASLASANVGPRVMRSPSYASPRIANGGFDAVVDAALGNGDLSFENAAIHLDTILANMAQGLTRLAPLPIAFNPRAGRTTGAVAAGTSGHLITVYDSTAEERSRFGDPRGTASYDTAVSTYSAATSAASGTAADSAIIVPAVRVDEFVSLVTGLLGFGGGGDAAPATHVVASDVGESVARCISELIMACRRGRFQHLLARPIMASEDSESASGASSKETAVVSPTTGSSASSAPGFSPTARSASTSRSAKDTNAVQAEDEAKASSQSLDLVWSAAAKGLLQALAGIFAVAYGDLEQERAAEAPFVTAQALEQLHGACMGVLALARDAKVVEGIASALALKTPAESDTPRSAPAVLTSPHSPASMQHVHRIAATMGNVIPPASPASGDSSSGSSLPLCGAAASNETVAPASVAFQLLLTAEASSRLLPSALTSIFAEHSAADHHDKDAFRSARQVLRTIATQEASATGGFLQSFAKMLLATGPLSPTSPLWDLLSRVSANNNSIPTLFPSGVTSTAAVNCSTGELGYLRVMSALGEAAIDSIAQQRPPLGRSELSLDFVCLGGDATAVKCMVNLWKAMGKHVISHEEPSTHAAAQAPAAADVPALDGTSASGVDAPAALNANAAAEVAEEAAALVAVKELQASLRRGVSDIATRILGHFDLTQGDGALTSIVGSPDMISLYRAALRQQNADVCATTDVEVLRRFCGLNCPSSNGGLPSMVVTNVAEEIAKASQKGTIPLRFDKARAQALASGGVLLRVILAIGLHSTSRLYAREAIRLLRDLGFSMSAAAGHDDIKGKVLVDLGLDEACLKVLQSAVKKLGIEGNDKMITFEGERLVAALSDVYANVSAKGFLEALQKAVLAAELCPFVRQADGTFVGPNDETTSECPIEYTRLKDRIITLHDVCRNLDADAVPEVPADLLQRAAKHAVAFMPDVRTCGVFLEALTKAGDYFFNLNVLGDASVMRAARDIAAAHMDDVLVAESVAAFFRPLSVNPHCIGIMRRDGILPIIISIAQKHKDTHLEAKAQPESLDDEMGNGDGPSVSPALAESLKSPAGAEGGANAATPTGPKKNEYPAEGPLLVGASAEALAANPDQFEPRISHFCIQSLANVACDQSLDEDLEGVPGFAEKRDIIDGAPGGTARIVAAGGVEALKECMATHLSRPRLLEDALCAMSNIAYTTDGVRLHIGRTASQTIVEVLRVFNGDAYLFCMALRAVGNLTRCDENIVSVVGQGVIEGIVEGMEKNADNKEVLRLCADVIGNLASLDEKAIDRAEGLKALRDGLSARGGNPSQLEGNEELADAVASWLLDDGADKGLVDAMVKHCTDAELVSACLRSLQYIGETYEHIERMQKSVDLAAKACLVIRSCDFDPELCCRGILLLAQMLRCTRSMARDAAFEAGAAQVILSVLETHRHDAEVVQTILRTIIILDPSDAKFISAALELQSPATILSIIEEAAAAATGQGAGQHTSTSEHEAEAAQALKERQVLLDESDEPRAQLIAVTPGEAMLVLRQGISVLTAWTKGKDISLMLSKAAARTAAKLLQPQGLAAASSPAVEPAAVGSSAHRRICDDGVIVEAFYGLLSPLAMSSPQAVAGMISEGILPVISKLAMFPTHLDRVDLIEHVLSLIKAISASSPEAALMAMENNCHGLCQCIAVHWALKRNLEARARKTVYDAAGVTLKRMSEASFPLRQRRAIEEAKAQLEEQSAKSSAPATKNGPKKGKAPPTAASSGAAADKAHPNGSPFTSNDSRPQRNSFVDNQKVLNQKLKEEKLLEKQQQKRMKDAEKVMKNMSKNGDATASPGGGAYDLTDLLETRAGVIPWALFPKGDIEKLVSAEDVLVDVWFLPGMAEKWKQKARKMKLTLSPDLRVLTYSYQSKHYKKMVDFTLPLSSVRNVRAGAQLQPLKKSLLGRSPKAERSICLDRDEGTTLLHLEPHTAEQHELLMRAFSVLCAYARTRDGVPEPLPTVHVDINTLIREERELLDSAAKAMESGDTGAQARSGGGAASPGLPPTGPIVTASTAPMAMPPPPSAANA